MKFEDVIIFYRILYEKNYINVMDIILDIVHYMSGNFQIINIIYF